LSLSISKAEVRLAYIMLADLESFYGAVTAELTSATSAAARGDAKGKEDIDKKAEEAKDLVIEAAILFMLFTSRRLFSWSRWSWPCTPWSRPRREAAPTIDYKATRLNSLYETQSEADFSFPIG